MKAEIYTSACCGYCVAAKQLLLKRNIGFTKKDVSRRVVMA